ncbi:glycosyltransferase involved in cell wall biosynthesis [Thermosporothrix hazakensis]|jgi:glycosyltransferase involved in cell wall biosynthesis|uniref:Glycosyltransferase involved in cell wall biosynthesis n=1 Tax=Thermosporothrix hazakensis TaxID=644383 RepID=A0A326U4T4_THEHA|nr:glycosyltransferase [Thermosporothrix hazakensis]PZW26318.1 glycosyltransferase involved in cell wall biosynthesis [Thermosporothrix hazakensis]GCE48731.1 transferase [Thermosporothrix hazakensis]
MGKSRRVAFLSEHADPTALLGGVDAGGQNVYVDEISRNLAQLGYTVDVFTRRDNPDTPEVIEWAPGVRVIHLTAGPATFLLKDELWPLMPEFRDAFLRFQERSGTHYDLIHSNFWLSGWVAAELRERLRIPAVQIFHAMGITKRRHQQEADTSPSERIQVEHEIIQRVDRLIAQCPGEQHELIEDYRADPAKIVMIPSAVNTSLFYPVNREEARRRVTCELHSDDFVIVYVGRMLPRKDARNIVRALAILLHEHGPLPSVKLVLVGGESMEPDPPLTPEIGALQELAAELGVADRVVFVGKRQPEVLRYYYCAGDVAVTTPWYEPFGLTPLEGQACGRPVIGSAVGGITFTIADGETGLLVPPRDPAALAERLYQLFKDRALCERMGEAARQRVEREFTWPVAARRTAELYQALLQEWRQPVSTITRASSRR